MTIWILILGFLQVVINIRVPSSGKSLKFWPETAVKSLVTIVFRLGGSATGPARYLVDGPALLGYTPSVRSPVKPHPRKHRAAGISGGKESGPPSGAWRSVRGFEADGGKMPKCPVSWRTGRRSHRPAFSSKMRRTACQIGSAHRHPAECAIPYAEYLALTEAERWIYP